MSDNATGKHFRDSTVVFQIMNMADATRTKPMQAVVRNLANDLAKVEVGEAAVIIIMDEMAGEFQISTAPVLHVKAFVELFADQIQEEERHAG